jgi:hypothetical protein
MLTSLANVHEQFFSLFKPIVNIPKGTDTVAFPVRYARESKEDYTEVKPENYPQITLLDYMPEFDNDWADTYKKRYGAFSKSEEGDDKPFNRAVEFLEPLYFMIKYDVTAFSKDAMVKWAVDDYFKSKYRQQGKFVFNKTVINTVNYNSTVGDVVGYTVVGNEIERSDGVFEQNYQFTIKCMVSITTGVDVELVEQLLINRQ